MTFSGLTPGAARDHEKGTICNAVHPLGGGGALGRI